MVIIDCEIKKAILGRNETPLEGIEYCGGWRDFTNMGISCVCTYDVVSHLSRVFLEEDFAELIAYLKGKRTAGFNTKRFDLPLLSLNGVDIDFGPSANGMHYDILEQIWLAQGLDPDRFNPRTHGGWGLDAVCQATLGIAKTGHGAMAPVWWQQGKRGKVIDYCLNDVWMEGRLLLHIMNAGIVYNSEDRPGIAVQPPVQGFLEPAFKVPESLMAVVSPAQTTVLKDVPMGVNNIVGGPKEPTLAAECQQWREEAERRAAEILNRPAGGLGIIR